MSLADALDLIHHHLTRRWSAPSTQSGDLSYSEYAYLRALERLDGAQIAGTPEAGAADHHGHHLQDLAAVLGVNKASASAAVAKLEKRGLIARFRCQYDARAQHIVLTETARGCLRRAQTLYEATAARIEARLTPAEAAALTQALNKIGTDL